MLALLLMGICLLSLGESLELPERLKNLRSKTPIKVQLGAALKLVERILPRHHEQIRLKPLDFGEDERDTFEIDGLTIRATSGVAAAAGLHHYLKTVCHASIHWGRNRTGFNLAHLPARLPRAPRPIRKSSGHAFRYYFNAVTFGYSAAWWEWERWAEEIDWAALHGINLFLALEGQEYIWEKLWLELGVPQQELEEKYFPGPAFLAWHRMGNLDGYAGPQPKDWRVKRFRLQKKILTRMRSLGMIPVQSAFAGHIPAALETVMRDKGTPIKVHRGATLDEGWCGFAPTTLLDADDPLFRRIGKRYLELQREAYGSDGVFSCDTFNEMHVPFTDAASLRASSKAVIDGMMEAEPEAVWLMQGWLFLFSRYWHLDRIEAYLSGVPNDRMIVLDLFAEKRSLWDETSSFFGKPWIWCQLLNFGGNLGLFGNMTRIAVEPARALHESPSFAGTGMSMEAIERNAVLFSMLSETVWTDDEVPIEGFLSRYVTSRYDIAAAGEEKPLLEAFLLLNASVYSWNGQLVKPPLEERPKFYLAYDFRPPLSHRYQPADVVEAFRKFLGAVHSKAVTPNGPLLQDVTDIGRQVVVDLFTDMLVWFETQMGLSSSDNATDMAVLRELSVTVLGIFDDLDAFLGANVNFMLGPVLHESTRVHGPETELQVRNILTLWGDGRILNDYAAKQYSPMVKDYYKERWRIWIDCALGGRGPQFTSEVSAFENEWFKRSKQERAEPVGHTLRLAEQLVTKYATFDGALFSQVIDDCYPVEAFQLHQTWTTDLGVLSFLCRLAPTRCAGFTSTGMIVHRLSGAQAIDVPGVKCFLLKDFKMTMVVADPNPPAARRPPPVLGNVEEVVAEEPSEAPAAPSESTELLVGVLVLAVLVYLTYKMLQFCLSVPVAKKIK